MHCNYLNYFCNIAIFATFEFLLFARFKLLNCGMSLLQGDVLPKSLAKHVLRCFVIRFSLLQPLFPRQRIYSCSLDFFCADKMYPVR